MEERIAISAHGLDIGYRLKHSRSVTVHESLDLELRRGELTCLLGLNGAGKSTLLRTLCGFQPPLGGEVEMFGRPLRSLSQSELSRMLGVVLTEKTNAGGISVRDLVALGRYPHTGFFARMTAHDMEVVSGALEAVGISHKADAYVSELSDGERQKAFIAKALAQECPVIVLDEPTAFLDIVSRIEVMKLLHKLATSQDKSILLSTHDLDAALRMADTVWILDKSSPMVCGTPRQLVGDGMIERFFGPEAAGCCNIL